jgi:hypothetical protein
MSGAILLGVVVGGIGWVALGSSRAKSAAAADLTVSDAKQAADVGEPQDNVSGISAIAGQVACATKGDSTLGGDPVAGTDAGNTGHGQTLSVDFSGPSGEGGMVVDHASSLGGSDPSTLRSGVSNSFWAGRRPNGQGENDTVQTSDISAQLYTAAYGDAGANGTTQRQRADKYNQLGMYTGEVW